MEKTPPQPLPVGGWAFFAPFPLREGGWGLGLGDRMDPFNPFDLSFTDPNHPFHLHHMEMCLEEAMIADGEDEVPIGAIVVHAELGVIGLAHNQREQLHDPTAHAELIAMTQAGSALKSWRL